MKIPDDIMEELQERLRIHCEDNDAEPGEIRTTDGMDLVDAMHDLIGHVEEIATGSYPDDARADAKKELRRLRRLRPAVVALVGEQQPFEDRGRA